MKWKVAVAGMMMAIMTSMASVDAVNAPVQLKADSIEYDSKQGVLVADGNVIITQDGAELTGASAIYNMKTKAGTVTGDVVMVQEGARLNASQVEIADGNVFTATGNVDLTKDGNRLTALRLVYHTEQEQAVADGGATLWTADGTLAAPRIEAMMQSDEAIATGGVVIDSPARNMTATSDTAYYYGSRSGQGKIILRGNARATQEGNLLTGNELTLLLDDNELQSSGQSHLVIENTESINS